MSGVSEELVVVNCTVPGAESGEHIHELLQSTPTLPKITLKRCGEVPVDALLLLMSVVSEELLIWDCTLPGTESGEHIHGLLQSTPTLPKITLERCFEVPGDALLLLMSGVSEELVIWRCTLLGAQSGEHLRKLMQSTPTLPKITLDFYREVPVDALLLLMSGVSEELVIVNCTLPGAESVEHLRKLMQYTPTLPKITLDFCREVPVDALLLLMSVVSEELVIVNCTLPGAESGEHIHWLLPSTPTPTLPKITLRSCGEVPVDALLLLMSSVSEELVIWDCTLPGAESGEHIHWLLPSTSTPTLPKITLRSCGEVPADALLLLMSGVSEEVSIKGCTLVGVERSQHAVQHDTAENTQAVSAPAVRMRLHNVSSAQLGDCHVTLPRVSRVELDGSSLDICDLTKLCPKLEHLQIGNDCLSSGCEVSVGDFDRQWESLRILKLCNSRVVQNGRTLTQTEAKEMLTDICHSAALDIKKYKVHVYVNKFYTKYSQELFASYKHLPTKRKH